MLYCAILCCILEDSITSHNFFVISCWKAILVSISLSSQQNMSVNKLHVNTCIIHVLYQKSVGEYSGLVFVPTVLGSSCAVDEVYYDQ